MNYTELKIGDTLKKNDEYSVAKGVWHSIPNFLVGDVIPFSVGTKWRRPNTNGATKNKKHWWKK